MGRLRKTKTKTRAEQVADWMAARESFEWSEYMAEFKFASHRTAQNVFYEALGILAVRGIYFTCERMLIKTYKRNS